MVVKLTEKRTNFELEVSARAVLLSKLEAALKEQSIARSQIDYSSSNEIIHGLDVEGAIKLVDHLSDELDRKRYELDAERVALPPAATQELFQTVESEIKTLKSIAIDLSHG